MAGFNNAQGNTAYLKQRFLKNVNAGEKLSGAEFKMNIAEYPDLEVLIRSAQMPAMGRADIEDFGQMGMKMMQHGSFENSGEVAVTAVSTISGTVLTALREIVRDKKYVTVTIQATPESTGGSGADSHKFKLEHVKIRSDAIDLSTEDTAALVKPAMTLQYNWFDV